MGAAMASPWGRVRSPLKPGPLDRVIKAREGLREKYR
jgi:hypothetical protein